MDLINRAMFIVAAFAIGGVGAFSINHFVLGNTGDALSQSSRIGEWRKAKVREACFPATESPERDGMAPKMPGGSHRISLSDFRHAQEMTVALNCYVVTKNSAVCEPDNRAWIVDYVGKYYTKRDQMLATARNYGDAEVRNVQQVWASPRSRAIETALAEHIRSGRLSKADFGWSTPAAIEPLLEQHAGAADLCPTERKS